MSEESDFPDSSRREALDAATWATFEGIELGDSKKELFARVRERVNENVFLADVFVTDSELKTFIRQTQASYAKTTTAMTAPTPDEANDPLAKYPDDYLARLRANPGLARELDMLRTRREARLMDAELEAANDPLPPVDFGSLDEILDRAEPTKWRVGDFLPTEGRLLLTAQRKAGKTTLVGNLTRSLLTGDVFLGRYPVEPLTGSVMVLNFEVSGSTLAGWYNDMDFPAAVRSRVQIVNLRGRENLLATERGRARLVEMMRATKTEVLVVDVFARAFSGDQNSNSEVAAWLGQLDRVTTDGGATELVLVAHAGWGASGRSRGASALEDWPDVIANLETEKTGEGDSDPVGARYFKAFGRDVDIAKGRLDFDPATRRLSYTGETKGSVRLSKKADELSGPILDVVTAIPGVTSGELKTRLRRAEVSFRDTDVAPAVRTLTEAGELVSGRQGKYTHLWLPKDLPEKFRDELRDP